MTEDLVAPPYESDNLYEWAKLIGELTLRTNQREHGMVELREPQPGRGAALAFRRGVD